MEKIKHIYSKKRKWFLKDKLRILQFAIFFLTIGFAGGLFWPLFHTSELRDITNQIQDRTQALDRAIETVRKGAFTPSTVSLLRKIGGKATNSLIKILRNEELPSFERRHSAIMLGLLSDQKAVPALVDVLQSSDDSSLRAQAASALGKIGDDSALPHLSMLLNDKNEEVRLNAIEAMSSIGGTEVTVTFIKTLEDTLKRTPEDVLSNIPQEEMEWWHYYSRIRKLGCRSIKEFQKIAGLTPDGMIGPRTRKAVDKIYKIKSDNKKH